MSLPTSSLWSFTPKCDAPVLRCSEGLLMKWRFSEETRGISIASLFTLVPTKPQTPSRINLSGSLMC